MLSTDNLIEIDGWERDHFGDYICEWVRKPNESESFKNEYDAFILVIQEQEENEYHISITVLPEEGGIGDLLSAEFSETSRTIEEANAIGEEFVAEIEDEYIN